MTWVASDLVRSRGSKMVIDRRRKWAGAALVLIVAGVILAGCEGRRKEPVGTEEEAVFAGKTFVITGALEHFSNRKALQELIESKGGKAAGSVSAKTSYLINNDVTSNSSKNKKAKELGVPILSEQDFLKLLEEMR